MTTSSTVGDYQELKEEVSGLASDIDELSEKEDHYSILQRIGDNSAEIWRIKGKKRILEDLKSVGLVEGDEDYNITPLGSAYDKYRQQGYAGTESLDFSEPEAIEKSLWEMSIGVDVGSDRVSCPVGDIAEELDRLYNNLREHPGDVPSVPDLGRREETLLYLELAESAQARGDAISMGGEFIGEVNSGLERKVDLYVGRIRDGGSNPFIPTQTGELVRLKGRVGEKEDNGLNVVRRDGVQRGMLGGTLIGSFEDSELKEFLYGINDGGN